MSTTLVQPAPAVSRPITLDLEVVDGPDVLPRVLSVLRRRRCAIRAVDFRAADRHGPARLLLGVDAPLAHAHLVSAWLEALVDVLAVSRADR